MTAPKPWLRGLLLLAALIGLALAWRALPIGAWVEEGLEPIRRAGAWGCLAYVAVYAVSVVLMVPGSALTLAAGVLYPLWLGTALVSAASTLGAALAFLAARGLARERVRRRVERDPRFAAIDRAVALRGAWVVFLLRLSPVVPFNLLNYALGLTGVGFVPYVLASWVGMLPGTLLYVMIGSLFGPSGRPGGLGPAYWTAVVAATLVATAYVGRLVRRALAELTETPPEPSPCPTEPTPSSR
jgi:uncharacterized membrane protein YdjX (TVP38/TMEM64 family)